MQRVPASASSVSVARHRGPGRAPPPTRSRATTDRWLRQREDVAEGGCRPTPGHLLDPIDPGTGPPIIATAPSICGSRDAEIGSILDNAARRGNALARVAVEPAPNFRLGHDVAVSQNPAPRRNLCDCVGHGLCIEYVETRAAAWFEAVVLNAERRSG